MLGEPAEPEDDGPLVLRHHPEAEQEGEGEGDDDEEDGEDLDDPLPGVRIVLSLRVLHRTESAQLVSQTVLGLKDLQ